MKKLFKKVVSVGLTAALTLSMAAVGISSASALSTNDYYNSYTTVADIKNRDGCSAMQGMAVGSTYLYTVKIKEDNSGAVLQKTNKNTGATTNLTNSTGSIYTYLNHANDMDVTTIDGYSQLFVATMATGSNSLVRIKVNGSKATKSGGYTLMYNGAQKSVSGVAVEWTDANNVYLLLKSGATVYRATVPKVATSGVINITKAFTINTGSVKVNGSYVNLSSYTHQGMGYHDGKIYVPLWGGGAGKSNQAVIAVYDTYNASGTVSSDPFLSFRVTSGAYSGFEIESCDISSDGQMYFNVNRWTSSSGNYDAILRFNGFVANGFNPDGNVDVISGGTGTVTVRGWAFDKDCVPMNIPVHVYIGGEAGRGEGHAITANTYRNDVNGAFGCGDYHGFDATISTSLRGSQPVYIYAINTRKGTNVMIGSGWVNITNETNPPSIGNVRVTEVSPNGYRVTCDVWDESGITSVKFPTWTTNNGQDDLIWHEGSVSGNTATCYISKNDHKGEYGTYITHIYAYDPYGNQSFNGDTNVYLDGSAPVISNVRVTEVSENGYRVTCDVSDDRGVTSVKFPTWTANNGQDDLIWHEGSISGNTATFYVSRNDHKGEYGTYYTHIYAYDAYGNYTCNSNTSVNVKQSAVNLGNDFYANISYGGKNLTITDRNVFISDKDGSTSQIWHFIRQSDGTYKIVNMKNGEEKCLDVYNASGASGANVQVYPDNGSTAQRWYVYSQNGKYILKALCAPNCALDIKDASTANGANAQSWSYHGRPAQQFEINKTLTPANIGNDFYANISYGGKNLTITDRNVFISDKDGSTSQIWHFIRQSDGTYKIVNMKNGEEKCLDVYNASGASGANVQVYTDNGSTAQRWYVYSQNGKYILKALCAPNCALDIKDASTANGANAQSWSYHGRPAQQFEINKTLTPANIGNDFYANISFGGKNLTITDRNVYIGDKDGSTSQIWHFIRQGDGTYKIVNMKNGEEKCLDVYTASPESGTNVQVYPDNGSTAQRWYVYSQNGKYILKSLCAPNCALDIKDASTANGANAQSWKYHGRPAQQFEINKTLTPANIGNDFYANISFGGKNLTITDRNVFISDKDGSTSQIWHFIRQSDGTYKIVNMKNGEEKCLDVYDAVGTSGANVQVYPDNGSKAQRWYVYSQNGKYILKALCAPNCALDIKDASTANGANAQSWKYHGRPAQQFEINKTLTPANIGNDFYANISFGSKNLTTTDRNVYINDKNGTDSQKWHFIRQGDGTYKIVNVLTSKCLDVYTASPESGTNVQVYADNGSTAQRWYVYSQNGKYILKSLCAPNCALDIKDASTANGANAQSWKYHGRPAQQFTINKI